MEKAKGYCKKGKYTSNYESSGKDDDINPTTSRSGRNIKKKKQSDEFDLEESITDHSDGKCVSHAVLHRTPDEHVGKCFIRYLI